MLSNETWNALAKIGKEKYAPMMGKRYRDKTSGYEGKAVDYTLSGQICLEGDDGSHSMPWADNLEEIA